LAQASPVVPPTIATPERLAGADDLLGCRTPPSTKGDVGRAEDLLVSRMLPKVASSLVPIPSSAMLGEVALAHGQLDRRLDFADGGDRAVDDERALATARRETGGALERPTTPPVARLTASSRWPLSSLSQTRGGANVAAPVFKPGDGPADRPRA